MNDKVSVVIPVHNTGRAAVKLVLTISKGNYKNLELILVDDGSTDESKDLMKEFVRQYKLKFKGKKMPDVKLIAKENGGVSSARNIGIERATGKYICFTDSDDKVDKDFYKKMLEAIKKYDGYKSRDLKNAIAVSGVRYSRLGTKHVKNIYCKDFRGRQPDETFKEYILRSIYTDGRLYAVTNKIYRADIIKHFGIRFDETMTFAEDLKFNLEYLACANRVHFSRVEFVLEPLYHYNYGTPTSVVGDSSLSWGNWLKSYKDVERFAGKKRNKKADKALKKIFLRWKVSHALAVARSKQTFGHKIQHIGLPKLLLAELIIKFRR